MEIQPVRFVVLLLATLQFDLIRQSDGITQTPCIPRNFGHGSVVCVCNGTYCDTLSLDEDDVPNEQFLHVISSQRGERFAVSLGNITIQLEEQLSDGQKLNAEFILTVNRSMKFQKILGFGGAFTDSTGVNLVSLSKPLQEMLIQSYYRSDGLDYNIGRVPMAGTDFSTHRYSYDDVVNDTTLTHFELTQEDILYKMPYLQKALDLQPSLKLLACPWSAPPWMKTNGHFSGRGFLKREFYQIWADYFIRFLQEYQKQNLTFWGVSTQNEPIDGLLPGFKFNCLGWTAKQQRDWIKFNLGPTLVKNGFQDTKVIIFDDQRPFLVNWVQTVLNDPDAAKYVSGVGLHWYMNYFPPSSLDKIHTEYSDSFLLSTEGCTGSGSFVEHVLLGDWSRAEKYAYDIIQNLNHWVTGWIDWNLILDLKGGPNWVRNFVDAPIIVDPIIDTAYKQPMYYALGHFSKFIPTGSIRIDSKLQETTYKREVGDIFGLETLSVLRPDRKVVIIVLNRLKNAYNLTVNDPDLHGKIRVELKGESIATIMYH